MSALPTLIRVAKWNMEEKRRTLVGLETLMANLQANRQQLETELEREQRSARHDEEALVFYGNYARAVIERRENLDRSAAELQEKVDVAHQEVTEAFQEVRRYEIVWEREQERAAAETRRKEQHTIDEMAAEMVRRRGASQLRNDRTRGVTATK
jgi:flagellar export protein FliJ